MKRVRLVAGLMFGLLAVCFSSIATLYSPVSMAQPVKAYFAMEPGIFSGGETLTVNGKALSPSVFGLRKYGIVEAMKDNPVAVEFAKKHEEYATWSGVAFWGGLAGAVGYLASARDDANLRVYWGVFGVGFITGAFLQQASMAYLYKAINAYNGVDSKQLSQFQFSVGPVADGAAMGLTYSY